MNGDEICVCGHVYDEHMDGGRECDIEECLCAMFEIGQAEAMRNYYISIEVRGSIAVMVDAKSIADAKRKILNGEFHDMDFMDVSLTEVKPVKAKS